MKFCLIFLTITVCTVMSSCSSGNALRDPDAVVGLPAEFNTLFLGREANILLRDKSKFIGKDMILKDSVLSWTDTKTGNRNHTPVSQIRSVNLSRKLGVAGAVTGALLGGLFSLPISDALGVEGFAGTRNYFIVSALTVAVVSSQISVPAKTYAFNRSETKSKRKPRSKVVHYADLSYRDFNSMIEEYDAEITLNDSSVYTGRHCIIAIPDLTFMNVSTQEILKVRLSDIHKIEFNRKPDKGLVMMSGIAGAGAGLVIAGILNSIIIKKLVHNDQSQNDDEDPDEKDGPWLEGYGTLGAVTIVTILSTAAGATTGVMIADRDATVKIIFSDPPPDSSR